MRIVRIIPSLSVSLAASALLAGSLLQASAAELQVPPAHKPAAAAAHKPAVAAVHAKRRVRHRLIRVATGPWLPRSGCGLACSFPLILGVAY